MLFAGSVSQFQRLQRDWVRDQCITVAQLRTDHSPLLAEYLHCIGCRDSATCPHCNSADETAEHLVLQCPAHDQVRSDVWPGGKFSVDPQSLRDFLERIGAVTRPPLTGNERESEHVGPAIVRSLTQVVTAWMGDCRSVNHLGNNQHQDQLCLPALCGREIEHLLVWLRLRQGMFTCVGWQVLLCDPVWQVTLGFFEMGFL